MDATKVSRTNIDVLSSLTAFFDLQDGQKSSRELHADVINYVFATHRVIWVAADVASVTRAASKRGGAIEHEIKLDEARKVRYNEAMDYIAQHSQTRTSERRATEEKQPIIDEYKKIITHTHLPLTLTQLALHRALQAMGERGKKRKAENEEEEKKVQAAIKQHNRDLAVAKSRAKQKGAEESAKKKREEAAARAAEEAQRTRAVNIEKAKALVEHNKDRYKRKREDGELKRAFMEAGLKMMKDMAPKPAAKEKKADEEAENDEENKENVENYMPM